MRAPQTGTLTVTEAADILLHFGARGKRNFHFLMTLTVTVTETSSVFWLNLLLGILSSLQKLIIAHCSRKQNLYEIGRAHV